MGIEDSSHRGFPDWEALYAVAQAQSGYFTTGQTATAGYSPQLLRKYLDNDAREAVYTRMEREGEQLP